jgi:hypothetical protein
MSEFETSTAFPKGVPQDGDFAGRAEFANAVRDALRFAHKDGWREMLLCDGDFLDWPLADRETEEMLQAWSNSQRKFTIIARDFDALIRTHHRFVSWRRQWSHIVDAWEVKAVSAEEFPSGIIGTSGHLSQFGNWSLHRLDKERSRGVFSSNPSRLLQLRNLIESVRERGATGFAATTLGL